ncbi:MAG: energy-coupling factor transporter transmembrane protein EcfT [Treponema sp.]|jgi:cobalt/nickel transport system permease protein|nr:energy-coupling factor transporter transmembrane protein EcfT [Treponema sp.]
MNSILASGAEKQEDRGGFLFRLNAGAKIGATLIYIVTVVSFDRHVVGRLTPFLLYPVLVGSSMGLPLSANLKRLLSALPFCVFAGLSNLPFERETAFALMGIRVSYGAVSCCSLIFRAVLCIEALIILTATTPIYALSRQLRALGTPRILVVLFEMTYRYISVLTAEARSLHTAYTLRGGGRGVSLRHAGSFIGSLFLRGMARAERVGVALKLRGYSDADPPPTKKPLEPRDAAFLGSICFFCLLFRLVDAPFLIGSLWFGLFK